VPDEQSSPSTVPSATRPHLRLVAEHDDVIEAAIDILAERHHLSREEARDLLGRAGRHGTRNVRDVAQDVVLIGAPLLVDRTQPRVAPSGPPTLAALVLDLLAESDTLQQVLQGIADLAVEEIDDVDSASITLIRDDAPATVVSSHEGAEAVDEAQYAQGGGPCLHAARTDTLVVVEDVPDGVDFEKWRRVAAAHGITGIASIPIPSTPHVAAALNLYTRREGGRWDRDTLDTAETLAVYTGDAVTVTHRRVWPRFSSETRRLEPPG
jgi:hypothetical protein